MCRGHVLSEPVFWDRGRDQEEGIRGRGKAKRRGRQMMAQREL